MDSRVMAYFAELDDDNMVVRVISVSNEVCGEPTLHFPDTEQAGVAFIFDTLKLNGVWKQTSFNHNFRKQYAGIGYTYDSDADVFIEPQPYPSWSLDENYDWQPPTPMPTDGMMYSWNEPDQEWVAVHAG